MIIRLENLNEMNETAVVDVRAIPMAYWEEANRKYPSDVETIDIEELSISANMPISELQKRKIDWKTAADDQLNTSKVDDAPVTKITMAPMQIRVFSAKVNPELGSAANDAAEDLDDEGETFIMI